MIFNVVAHADGGQSNAPSVSLSSPNNNNVTISITEDKDRNEENDKTWVDIISAIGSLGSFAVAFSAVVYTYFQYKNNKKENRRSQAYQNYSLFLQLAFDNPKFANPTEGLMCNSINEDLNIDKEEMAAAKSENLKYKYFVANMLFAFEQIFLVIGNEPDWQAVMRDHLLRHKNYLNNSKSIQNGHWNVKFRDFIKSTIQE